MTTVDFRARPLSADAKEIGFSNGLSGPATTAFHGFRRLVESGAVAGRADEASASGRIPGNELRELLAGLGEHRERVEMFVSRIGHSDEATLQAAIDDAETYTVSALEV